MDRNRILFWRLVEPEHRKVQAFCRRLEGNRDDGDDLCQEALVCALTGFASLEKIEAFRPWLYRIIVNCFRSRRRRPWWRKLVPLDNQDIENSVGHDPAPTWTARRRLEIAFRALSDADRALVTLFELEGWSIAELAELTGRTVSSVKVRLFRARRRMRSALIKHFYRSEPSAPAGKIWSEDEICVVTKPVEE